MRTFSVFLAVLVFPCYLLLGTPPRQVSVARHALHQFEDGPIVPSGYEFLPGETVFLSFHVAGFQPTEKDKISLEYRIAAFDPKGVPIVPERTDKTEVELAPEDKDWLPKVSQAFVIPPEAGSGEYHVKVFIKDNIGNSQAEAEIPFHVKGRELEPSETLVIRDFRFLRSEEDVHPLDASAAYRPGNPVWARFEIVGYKYGEGNHVEVEYGLKVLRPSGTAMYTEPKAASIIEAKFYPKRFAAGILSLQLDQSVRPGEYTIVLEVRDVIGKQTHESQHVFRVE